jgi:hypothetical protein
MIYGFITTTGRYYDCTDEAHARQLVALLPGAELVREEWVTVQTGPGDEEYELSDTKRVRNLVSVA